MTPELSLLLGTAVVLGVTHTAIGIDHSLPFVLIGRARGWSLAKTLGITSVCGIAHVMSSVLVGLLGVGVVFALGSLHGFEESRGNLAAWLLVAFGFGYALLSFWRMRRGSAHRHLHVHADGTVHRHDHAHVVRAPTAQVMHEHAHESSGERGVQSGAVKQGSAYSGRVALALLVIFLVGPCEALLPLMTAPALSGSAAASMLVAAAFGGATLLTMLALVAIGYVGLRTEWTTRFERHLNWIAGVSVGLSGLGIQLLGF